MSKTSQSDPKKDRVVVYHRLSQQQTKNMCEWLEEVLLILYNKIRHLKVISYEKEERIFECQKRTEK